MAILVNLPDDADNNYSVINEGTESAGEKNATAASCPYPMDSKMGAYWLVGFYSRKYGWDIEV